MYYIKKYGAVRLDILQRLLYNAEKEGKMGSVIKENKKRIIEDLKNVLLSLEELGKRLGMEDVDELRKVREELESPFSIVFVGEFNRGKSSIINALLGAELMEVRNDPTTSAIYIIEYSDTNKGEDQISPYLRKIGYNSSLLKDIRIVDTPGIRSLKSEHEKILKEYLAKADMVFFVMDVNQPLTKDEMELIKKIREHRSKIVILLNKIDKAKEIEIQQAVAHIEKHIPEGIGFVPEIIKVSAEWEIQKNPNSNFDKIRDIITNRLSDNEKLRIKLSRPIDIAKNFHEKCEEVVDRNKELIKKRSKDYEDIESTLNLYISKMDVYLNNAISDLDNIMKETSEKAIDYIDDIGFLDVLPIPRIGKNKQEILKEFDSRVVSYAKAKIDALIEKTEEEYKMLVENIIDHIKKHSEKEIEEPNLKYIESFILREVENNLEEISKNASKFGEEVLKNMAMTLGGSSVSFIGATAVLLALNPISYILSAALAGAFTLIVGAVGAGTFMYGKKKMKEKITDKLNDVRGLIENVISQNTEELKRQLDKKVLLPLKSTMERFKWEYESYEKLSELLADIYQKIRKLESEVLYSS
ncbi:MAG: dynamin family protein [Candidatus Aenigmatarchaeota archaeon]